MSRRAIKSINWSALTERIPESEKAALTALKAKSDQFLRRMTANPEAAPKIDWSYYKKTVASPGLVDKFQKEYEALSIPYPVDKYVANVDAQEKEANQQMEEFVIKTDAEIVKAQQEIEEIRRLLPFAEMTMEDFQDAFPDLAFNRDKPSVWPHIPEVQPEAVDNLPDEKH